jgi:hypothetical protein
MRDGTDTENGRSRISRRTFLGAASAAAGFTIVPRHVLGGAGFVPPSDKLNLAFIGVGAQGLRVMLNFLKQPDVQGIAVCDVNQSSADYPQWGQHEFRNSVQKLLGVSTGWDWLSPETPIKLSPSLQVTAGMAGRDPCQKIVDAYNGKDNRSGQSKGCAAYSDFRELLAKEQGVDGVVVCTPDHWHAPVSMAAMRLKKHVYVQKPSAHIVGEARQMAQAAQENGVATQVAVANSASENTRLLCEWIWSGAIGPARAELVLAAVLAGGNRSAATSRSSPGRTRLGPVAWSSPGTSFQSCLPSFCLARLVRLWRRIARGHGALQLRRHVSRDETDGSDESGSKLHDPLQGDLSSGPDHSLRVSRSRVDASGDPHLVRRRLETGASRRARGRSASSRTWLRRR